MKLPKSHLEGVEEKQRERVSRWLVWEGSESLILTLQLPGH